MRFEGMGLPRDDEQSLELELELGLEGDDEEDVLGRRALAGDDGALGPIDDIDDDDLVAFRDDVPPAGADDLLGLEVLDDEATLFDDEDVRPALEADDAHGPLLDEEPDLGLSDRDEPITAAFEGDDEGNHVDDLAFDLVELPPLALDDGALFDEALDDLELEPDPGLAPAPPRVAPSPSAQERPTPT